MTKVNLFIMLSILALISILVSLFKGSTLISFYQLFIALFVNKNPLLHDILIQIRLPHTLSAFVTGGLLALAGAMMQVLLRNPLADPYVLGVSGGAAVSTLLLMLLGLSGFWLIIGSWAGSLMTILLVVTLANMKKSWATDRLLLTGVALACGFSASISFILLMSPDKALRGMLFWLIGDLSFARLPLFEGFILLLGVIWSTRLARELNILTRGEREAKALGVNPQHLRWKIYFLSSLLTATAVTLAGCIGFIGLIVPHIFRLFFGYDHRFLLPGCVLLGGSLLTIADTLARTLITPQQLPVGIVMALIGVPMFLILLQKNAL